MNAAYGSSSRIGVQNIGSAQISADLKLYPAGSTTPIVVTKTIPPHASIIFRSNDPSYGLPTGFNGSLVVDASGPVVATAEETDDSGRGAYAFEGVGNGANVLYFPSMLCNAYGDQISYYAIQNASLANTASVTATFYNTWGGVINSMPAQNLPAGGKLSVNPCLFGVPSGSNGSAKFQSTGAPIIGIGKVKSSNGMATAFVGQSVGFTQSTAPYIRWAADPNAEFRSYISIMNVGSAPAYYISAVYWDANGIPYSHDVATGSNPLDPFIKRNTTPPDAGAPANFGISPVGGALEITSDQPVVAVIRNQRGVSPPIDSITLFAEDYNSIQVTQANRSIFGPFDNKNVRFGAPPPSTSYYVLYMNTLNSLGYALGQHDRNAPGSQDNLVILDFGYPATQGSNVYGVNLVGGDFAGIFYSTTDVINAAINFASGYFYGTGSDYGSHLRLVIGVNNCCQANSLSFFQNHGTAWGQVINSIRSGISAYSRQVDVVGGNDIEMSSNDPYATTQWFNNYMTSDTCTSGADNSENGCFYNFGNLAISISGTTCATSRSSPWVACDVWKVSWGAKKNNKHFARPLPEIYHGYATRPPWGTDATAWKDLSVFSNTQMNAGPIYFVGSLTQRARCGDGCGKGNNYPWEGYMLLYDALANSPTTFTNMRWSTDIAYQP